MRTSPWSWLSLLLLLAIPLAPAAAQIRPGDAEEEANCARVSQMVEANSAPVLQELERLVAERTLEIQDSEARFRQLAEASFEGVAIVDNGILVDGNQRFAEMHGYELAEILGRPGAEFIAPQSQSLLADDFHVSHQKSRRGYGLRKDGSIFPAEVRARIGPWLGCAGLWFGSMNCRSS